MDVTGCAGGAQAVSPGVQWCPEATMLLGIPGLVVTAVAQNEDGETEACAITHPDLEEQARSCPGCGSRGVIKQRPSTTPRDIPWGPRAIRLKWRKRRMTCKNGKCPVGTFTEWLPAVP
ncbi:MAG TPA: transposase family protein, partial [Streptosporangiaceae bacterium]